MVKASACREDVLQAGDPGVDGVTCLDRSPACGGRIALPCTGFLEICNSVMAPI
jgi:hypothetical protein